MKESLHEFFELMQTNMKLSQWVQDLTVEQAVEELRREIDEFQEAIKNNDVENFKEELGDILHDCFLLMVVAEKRNDTNSKEIVQQCFNKLSSRKPFLLEGRAASLDEEWRIWKKVKSEEKQCEK